MAENDRVLPLGRGRQRALLGLLLLRANEVVAQDLLVDELWGESPPPTALTALHGYVSRLRRLLGSDRLETRPPGYLLRVAPTELDLHRFRRLFEQGRYRQALALWRGPPLSDLAFEAFAQVEIARLEELRLAALEGRFERELAGGRGGEIVGELDAAARTHPLRERLTAQLMLALYRAGCQADALAAFTAARSRLVDELGIEPGEDLQRLQRRILEHDPALDAVSPPRRRGNLPAATTSFVGRLRELEQVRTLLARDSMRLLTLTGVGGSGKTRLALEIARAAAADFDDGVCFVALAPVTDPELVAHAIAEALELRQSPRQPIEDKVKAFVRERELLLVLDNFEHLLDSAPLAAELLAAAPGLTILATSRTHLNLYGETDYAVPPLALPDARHLPDVEALARLEAVALFVDRAGAVRVDFALDAGNAEAVAGICARLDGLPLALELAAARIRTLAPAEILAHLDRRLELLTGGPRDVPARQRTLRDTLLWSYELLTPAEQRLFARLAVFAGGWSAQAAEDVCDAADHLASVRDKQLVSQDDARFTMLATIRELALEQLADGEASAIRGRHARWFLALAEEGGPNRRGAEREAWLDRIALEQDNVRAALAWCGRAEDEVETGLRLCGAVFPFWTAHALIREGRRVLAPLLSRSRQETSGRARALACAGFLAVLDGDLDVGEPACRECLRLSRPGDDWYRAVSLNALGTTLRYRGSLAAARRLYEDALTLAGEADLWWPTALAHGNLGTLAGIEGRHREAMESHERAVATARAGGDGWMTAIGLSSLGRVTHHAGELQRAIVLQGEALRAFDRMDNAWGIAACLAVFAGLAADRGRHLDAARLYGAGETVRERAGVGLWRTIRADHDAGVRAVALALGEAPWSRARAEGRALTREEAIAQALALDSETG